ncbi:YceD family protein [Microbacterium sp. NPDC058389]|uniref:YceD family protein n=1 Tax=Microbacterium sp. NPDC058389 TaxID=3346475 RepID=UPI00364E441B
MTGPFAIPVRDLVHRPGEMREHSFEVPAPDKWGEGLVAVPEGETVAVDVRLESVHEGILVSGDIDTEYAGVCGRCLTDIAQGLQVEFQELFAYPGEDEADFEVQDDHVDLETLVREAVVLSLPFQPVCQPDCPGLDPATGERLTDSAGAELSQPADPRWAALQDFTPDVPRSRGDDPTEES